MSICKWEPKGKQPSNTASDIIVLSLSKVLDSFSIKWSFNLWRLFQTIDKMAEVPAGWWIGILFYL